MAIWMLCSENVRMGVHFFVNFGIFKWLYLAMGSIYTKRGDFVNLGVLFLTMWINSY